MNERLRELVRQSGLDDADFPIEYWDNVPLAKFAELIVAECTAVLFDESERLSGLYSEEADMQQAERYELCSEQCTDNIVLIEKHFGVE